MKKQSPRAIGNRYEDLACSYLLSQGYTVMDRNFAMRGGELDIIAKRGDTIVFTEVRYRADEAHGNPLETITAHKIRRICKTAQYYLSRRGYNEDTNVRFDVIAVTGEKIDHITDAFAFCP